MWLASMLAHHIFYRLIKAWMRVLVLIQIHNKCSHLTFFNFRFGHMYIILNLSFFHHIQSYLLSSLEWQIWARVLNLLIPHYICKWSKFSYRFQALLWYITIYNTRSNDNSDCRAFLEFAQILLVTLQRWGRCFVGSQGPLHAMHMP